MRKDDLVEVIAGNDRGKRGRVLKVIPKKERVLIQGVNLRWKHMRKSQQSPQGGRVRKEIPVHVSNVMLVDESIDARTRVSAGVIDGKKVRISRKSGKEIGTAPVETTKTEKASKKAEEQE
ncbi:MAG: 50S ribosomal protein L24 [Planctomycetota bacterium]